MTLEKDKQKKSHQDTSSIVGGAFITIILLLYNIVQKYDRIPGPGWFPSIGPH